ncbi:MAG: isoprenylcysteine carboxylmethyltransferase family protein [Muriicola sp.]|nr:isoprenylcysteine carboxylmethyltransferase family protein [Muriicola sp.]NNK10255.1 isoprenylcysteine carboxylmethyltransferase family protein [Flavobacteriaceae bacterium]
MKFKLPPVVIFFIAGLLMYLLATYLPVGYFDFFGRQVLKKVLAVLAVVIACISIIQFLRARTTTDPLTPSKAKSLVTGGIYSYSRNPMYLAMLLILIAWGLALGNAFNTLIAAGFVSVMNRVQIKREEAALLEKFGKEYRQYCLKVRRWF